MSSDNSTVNPGDVYIRFLFANGTASDDNPPKAFPLFGQTETKLKWNIFADEMAEISFAETTDWCATCGTTEGICSITNPGVKSAGGGCGSNLIVGIDGAVVTLVVIIMLVTLTFWLAELHVVKKRAVQQSGAAGPKTGHDEGSYQEHV